MKVVRELLICCCLVFACIPGELAQARVIDFTSSTNTKDHFVIDIRANELCEKASLTGARCLPSNIFLTPSGALANFSGILWMLGAVGLTGAEHVLVSGDSRVEKEFVAGVLYLSGQSRISILAPSISSLKTVNLRSGEQRSKTRERVFQALMRDQALILPGELRQMISEGKPLAIFDIRSKIGRQGFESENKIAGSVKPPIKHKEIMAMSSGKDIIIYGHKSKDSIAALARFESMDVRAKALLDGWAGWMKTENGRTADLSFKKIFFAFLSLVIISAALITFFRLQANHER